MARRRLLLYLTVFAGMLGMTFTMIVHMRATAAPTLGWISETIEGLHYEVLLPADYKPTGRYPVLLYMHQYAMGNYREALLKQVEAWFGTPSFRARHPAIVIVPMLDQASDPGANFGGKRAGHSWEDATIAALRQTMERYSVNPGRIYVTGNSMGGMGTWDMLLSYNAQSGTKGHIFAAGMPVAGRHQTANPEAAAKVLQHVPIWAIHGAKDPEVPLDWDRSMARLLADSPTFHYTEDPELPHDVWDSYYTRPDVWDWLFAQQREA